MEDREKLAKWIADSIRQACKDNHHVLEDEDKENIIRFLDYYLSIDKNDEKEEDMSDVVLTKSERDKLVKSYYDKDNDTPLTTREKESIFQQMKGYNKKRISDITYIDGEITKNESSVESEIHIVSEKGNDSNIVTVSMEETLASDKEISFEIASENSNALSESYQCIRIPDIKTLQALRIALEVMEGEYYDRKNMASNSVEFNPISTRKS